MNSVIITKFGKDATCSSCGKNFSTSKALNQHCRATRHNIIKYPTCENTFTSNEALRQHSKMVHQKQFTCTLCKGKFETETALNQHIDATHNEKFRCPKCKISFNTEKDLNLHIRNEKMYICSNCKKSFSSQNGLNQHNNSEKCKRKGFTCSICKKDFKTITAVNQHLKSGSCQNKSIVCSICGKSFNSKNSKNQHMTSSHLKRTIKCNFCNKSFKTLPALEQHKREKHSNLISLKKNKIERVERSSFRKANLEKKQKANLILYERTTITEKIRILLRKLLRKRKTIIMDECLQISLSVIDALKERYNVIPLPLELKTQFDDNLRLAISEKKFGLATKDQEMAILARKSKIKPVYLLIERKGNRALIRIRRNKN